MEIRQLEYFLKVIECGSMGKAAIELDVGTSALSQQIAKLEGELSTRLLSRASTGAMPTAAGIAFMTHAKLALRQLDRAVVAAHDQRSSESVSIGLPPTIASILALPLIVEMQERFPQIKLQIVESLSGHLASMINTRNLDMAIMFSTKAHRRWHVRPLLRESLFFISSSQVSGSLSKSIKLRDLATKELILPSADHGLRSILDASFERLGIQPNIVMEIDGLAILMEAVKQGFGATVQPGSALARLSRSEYNIAKIQGNEAQRNSYLSSLPEDELSPAALVVRSVILKVAQQLVNDAKWPGVVELHSKLTHYSS